VEHKNLVFSNMETWLGVSAAVLLAAHYIGKKLSIKLRRMIVIAYGLYVVTALAAFFDNAYSIIYYSGKAASLGGEPYPQIEAFGWLTIAIIIGLLLVGSWQVSLYFLNATKPETSN
jgi:hypothetical protein